MSGFDEARADLLRVLGKVFPNAKPVPRWSGIETWGIPRPKAAIAASEGGTYDPAQIVVGIADRKSGPVIYFLDPGDYHALETHQELLTAAGLKIGRGCIMHTRKGPLPVEAVETLLRRTKERDARAAGAAKTRKTPSGARSDGASMGEARSVDEYLAALPAAQRAALAKVRAQIRAAAPAAIEKISYGMPAYAHEGPLVYFAAFTKHLSLFTGTSSLPPDLREALRGFQTSKGTLRFTPERPIPAALVKRLVRHRIAANEARAAARAARRAAKAPPRKAARKAASPKAGGGVGRSRARAPRASARGASPRR